MLTALAAFVLLAAASAGIAPSEASASEVVDVRVGLHATFTRIVFELDTPAGYRIERSANLSDEPELVVSIDATSIPRELRAPRKALIGRVKVVPQGDTTVVRVRLTTPGLKVKEMILASPPRIVFDVLSGAPSLAKKKSTAVAATPRPKASAKVTPKPKAQPKPVPTPTRGSVQKRPDRVAKTVAPPKPSAAGAAKKGAGAAPEVSRRVPIAGAEPSEGGIPTLGGAEAQRTKPAPRAVKAATKPPKATGQKKIQAAKAKPQDDSPSGMTAIVLAVGALVVVVVAIVIVRRRVGGAKDEEYEDTEALDAPFVSDNPFADLGSQDDSQPVLSTDGQAVVPVEDDAAGVAVETLGALDASEVTGEFETSDEESVFDFSDLGGGGESTDEGAVDVRGASMELGGEDTVVSGIGSPGMASELEPNKEVTRMMQEFERRIASMESRLDEVVDARERLERQVAAQTEELRVQRAAIARTQRAVRNLTRSDDEVATEPALRDPS